MRPPLGAGSILPSGLSFQTIWGMWQTELVQRVASQCGVVPADVVFVTPGSLPRTTSGKLRRLQVKNTLEAVRT